GPAEKLDSDSSPSILADSRAAASRFPSWHHDSGSLGSRPRVAHRNSRGHLRPWQNERALAADFRERAGAAHGIEIERRADGRAQGSVDDLSGSAHGG